MLPEGDEWAYEPKYDGFRALAFVDGSKVFLQSRGARPLLRYFPELSFPVGRYVIDGELVILDDDGREVFDSLQARLHPAESRVKMLAEQTPALFRAFDLLAEGKTKLMKAPVLRAPRRAQGSHCVLAGEEEVGIRVRRAHPADEERDDGRAVAPLGRGRDRQAARQPPTSPASARGW